MSDIETAAERIRGILSPEGEPEAQEPEAPTPEEEQGTEAVHETAAEAPGDEPEGDAPQGEGDGEPETVLAAPATMNEAERAVFEQAPREVQQWSLRLHQSQQSTLTSKSQEIADTKKALEAEQAALEQQRQTYAQRLETLPEVPLPHSEDALKQLREDDPVQWSIAVNENQLAKEAQNSRQADREKLQREQMETLAGQQAKAIEDAAKQLPDLVPEWKDEKVATTEKAGVVKYLKGYGYDDDTISRITDPRIIAITNDARKWRELQAGKVTQLDKVKKAPKMGAPGSPKGKVPSDALKKAQEQAKKSGKVDDAAKLFELRFQNRS